MNHDLIISGGTIIDGTGTEGVRGDLAVDDGRITRLGDLGDASAAKTIDATGKLVTPGFVDLHTHLDAQVGWDPLMRSSSNHGVTTALIGNCGVTFAPVGEKNRRYLAELMEAVEDISADAIMDGLPWNWTSYGEFLDAFQSLGPAINVVGMVGHSPVRLEAMGDKCLDEGVQASDDELAHIERLVRESVAEGAAGFSTSRFLQHRVPDGRCTPGTWANEREIEAIQRACIEAGGVGALYQVVPDMFSARKQSELAMIERGAELGCQVLMVSGALGDRETDGGVGGYEEYLDRNNAAGRRIAAICQPRPGGFLMGLYSASAFRTRAWRQLMELPTLEDRVEALKDSKTKELLISEARASGFAFSSSAEQIHPLGTEAQPQFDLDRVASLADLAEQSGKDPIEIYVERLIESEGRELFAHWNLVDQVENQLRYLRHPHCIPMLCDAGAHVSVIMDTDAPTFLLTELTRKRGIFTLPEVIHRITQQSADLIGLDQRGVVREGWHADLNVIDYENLEIAYPEYVHDIPHGGGRFTSRGLGYAATVVGGEVVVENSDHTGARPGQVIRDFVRG